MTRLFHRDNLGCFVLFFVVALALLTLLLLWPAEAGAVDLSNNTYRLQMGDRMILMVDKGHPAFGQQQTFTVRSNVSPWATTGQDENDAYTCTTAAQRAAWLARYGVYFGSCRDPDPSARRWTPFWGQHGYYYGLRSAFEAHFGRDWRVNGRERVEVHAGAGYGLPTCSPQPGCQVTPPGPPPGSCQPSNPPWNETPLLEVPFGQRPPTSNVVDLNAGDTSGECRCWRFTDGWLSPKRLHVNFRRPQCFEGLADPEGCRTPSGLTAACWDVAPPPPPPPPVEPPPVEVPPARLLSLECGAEGRWILEMATPDETLIRLVTVAGVAASLYYEGEPVFEFTPDEPCSLSPACPAAATLDQVRGLVCEECGP